MPQEFDPEPLLQALQAVQKLLSHYHNRGVVIGGFAVSLISKPRYTEDIDAILLFDIAELDSLLEVAAQYGLYPRPSNVHEFVSENRVIPFLHTSSGARVDISLAALPSEEEAIQRARTFHVENVTVPVLTPEDLMIYKALAHRPKDLADIQTVAGAHPDLDRSRIQYWVKQFAEFLDEPDLWRMVEPLLPALSKTEPKTTKTKPGASGKTGWRRKET